MPTGSKSLGFFNSAGGAVCLRERDNASISCLFEADSSYLLHALLVEGHSYQWLE